ncbi:hypothetical protein D9M72_586680 [compost metagenome]
MTPAITPVSGLRISSSHSSSKAWLRLLRKVASRSGRPSSWSMALIPVKPRDSTGPATRPMKLVATLAAPLVASSVSSCSLVSRVMVDSPSSVFQAPAPLGELRIRCMREA